MIEIKNGQDYAVYDNRNVDPFTWKQQEVKSHIRLNAHGMVEVFLDLN